MRNSMRRSSGTPRVALDHAGLNLDRAAHGVDHAAELDEAAVAGALDDAAVMQGDGRIDQVAVQRPQPRQNAILVRSREPAKADDIRNQNRRNLPGLAQGAPSRAMSVAQNPLGQCAKLIEAIQLTEGGLEPLAESRLGVELTRPRRRRMTAFCG